MKHICEDNLRTENWLDEPVASVMSNPLYILMAQEDEDFDLEDDEALALRDQLKLRESFERNDFEHEFKQQRTSLVVNKVIERSVRIMLRHKKSYDEIADMLRACDVDEDMIVDVILKYSDDMC